MTALLCEEYQWSNYSYIGRPRRRPVLIFHRLPRERSERAPKSTANNGSSEPPLRHAPRGLSEQTAKHWLSPRRAENRDKMIKNCQAGLAITRSAVSPRQDKSLRFFSSLLSLCEPPSWDVGGRVGSGQLQLGGVAGAQAGQQQWREGPGLRARRWVPRVKPLRLRQVTQAAQRLAPLVPPTETQSGHTCQDTPVGGQGLGHTCEDTPAGTHSLDCTCCNPPARDTSSGSPGVGAPWPSPRKESGPPPRYPAPSPSACRPRGPSLGTLMRPLTTGPKQTPCQVHRRGGGRSISSQGLGLTSGRASWASVPWA